MPALAVGAPTTRKSPSRSTAAPKLAAVSAPDVTAKCRVHSLWWRAKMTTSSAPARPVPVERCPEARIFFRVARRDRFNVRPADSLTSEHAQRPALRKPAAPGTVGDHVGVTRNAEEGRCIRHDVATEVRPIGVRRAAQTFRVARRRENRREPYQTCGQGERSFRRNATGTWLCLQ